MTAESLSYLEARRLLLAGLPVPGNGSSTAAAAWRARQLDVLAALNQTVGRGLPSSSFGSAADRAKEWPLNPTYTKHYTHPTLGSSLLTKRF